MAWDLLEENFNDLTAWTDADSGDGESEISPAGILKQSNTNSASYASITYNYTGPGDGDFTAEFKIKFGTLPAVAHSYELDLKADRFLMLVFRSAGMQIDGSNTAITQTWVADTWYTIRVIMHTNQTKVDSYLDGDLKTSDVAGGLWEQALQFKANSQNIIANCDWSVDYLYIGAGQQVPSTTSIKKVSGVAHASIKKIGGVAIGDVKKIGGVE